MTTETDFPSGIVFPGEFSEEELAELTEDQREVLNWAATLGLCVDRGRVRNVEDALRERSEVHVEARQ